ncbi:MAG: hypothetical protein AAF335_03475 [Bacteroidota bacterium]
MLKKYYQPNSLHFSFALIVASIAHSGTPVLASYQQAFPAKKITTKKRIAIVGIGTLIATIVAWNILGYQYRDNKKNTSAKNTSSGSSAHEISHPKDVLPLSLLDVDNPYENKNTSTKNTSSDSSAHEISRPKDVPPLLLLDIDNTAALSFSYAYPGFNKIISDMHYNRGLIEAIKATGIKDIYLFSKTSGFKLKIEMEKEGSKGSRKGLVDLLKKEGFHVLGIITGSDATYQKGLGKAYEDLNTSRSQFEQTYPQHKKAFYTGKEVAAYEAAFKVYIQDKPQKEGWLDFERFDQLAAQSDGDRKKEMFTYFLKSYQGPKRLLVLIDDSTKVLKTTQKVFEEQPEKSKDFGLCAIQVPFENKEKGHFPQDKDYYVNIISTANKDFQPNKATVHFPLV